MLIAARTYSYHSSCIFTGNMLMSTGCLYLFCSLCSTLIFPHIVHRCIITSETMQQQNKYDHTFSFCLNGNYTTGRTSIVAYLTKDQGMLNPIELAHLGFKVRYFNPKPDSCRLTAASSSSSCGTMIRGDVDRCDLPTIEILIVCSLFATSQLSRVSSTSRSTGSKTYK